MTKKTRFSLILIYCLAITLLFLPFIKQALIIYQTETIPITPSKMTSEAKEVLLDAVQPPGLTEVLAFDKKKSFHSAGQIVIPKAGISLPVFSGVTNEQLLVGVGTLFPERRAEQQNIVLLGHHLGRENLLFGKLLKVTVGDMLYLEYQNQFYQYRVMQTKVVPQTELQVLANNQKAEITLITCDKPTYTDQRFIVKGELIEGPEKTLEQTIVVQQKQIREENKQKNRLYCVLILMLFLMSGIIGIGIITKISKR